MLLWLEWYRCVRELRPACSRNRTFLWMCLVLVGFSIRTELFGVTSFVRSCFLRPEKYRRLLHLFHTTSLKLEKLSDLWCRLAGKLFAPVLWQGYRIFIADGLKVPKEGKKMPAVKALHQESQNNSKPAFIMGHSFQAIGMLAKGLMGGHFCVPLVSRIHEGLVWSNRDRRTLLDKLVGLFLPITKLFVGPAILLADAYYASGKVIRPLLEEGHHLVTRVRTTTVGYQQLYGYRFKIEVSFKQALHTLGTYAYHFWMMHMVPIRRRSGNQHLHHRSEEYREMVRNKVAAYHRYVQLGCIAQGLLQHLSVNSASLVWQHFNSWLRTMFTDRSPSEMVVGQALRSSLPAFLAATHGQHELEKFIVENADLDRMPNLRLSA